MQRPYFLAPKKKRRVIDLVEKAGVDVSDWANFKGGKKNAAKNPKYCYEWAFIQPKKVVVLNIWWESLKQKDGTIWCDLNERESARRAAQLPSSDPRRRRRKSMDEALRKAFSDRLRVRLVLVSGKKRHLGDLQASRVTKRELDPAPWAVKAYDFHSGQCKLTRNVAPVAFGVEKSSQTRGEETEQRSDAVRRMEEEIEKSAGFQSNPRIRKAVEQHAMRRVECEFRRRGYKVSDVSRHEPFDLLCTKKNEERYVEVKGMQGSGLQIVLTAREVKFIQNNEPNCVLCVVQNIRVAGKKELNAAGGSVSMTKPFDLKSGSLRPLAFTFRREV